MTVPRSQWLLHGQLAPVQPLRFRFREMLLGGLPRPGSRSMWRLLSDTLAAFWKDECPRLAAALAFYTVFTLPAVLTFTVLITAAVVSREAVTARLGSHLEEAIGPEGA